MHFAVRGVSVTNNFSKWFDSLIAGDNDCQQRKFSQDHMRFSRCWLQVHVDMEDLLSSSPVEAETPNTQPAGSHAEHAEAAVHHAQGLLQPLGGQAEEVKRLLHAAPQLHDMDLLAQPDQDLK